jgi:hypothetical protein
VVKPWRQEVVVAVRFKERVDIRPAVTAGAAGEFSSLSQRLNEFAAMGAQLAARGQKEEAAKALEAGQAEFDRDVPLEEQRKEEPFFFGSDERAYNKGLRAAYLADIDNDNRLEVGRIQAENKDNLLGFNDAIEAYREATLNNVDPSAKNVVSSALDEQINRARLSVQANTIQRQYKETQTTLATNAEAAGDEAARLARNGDLQGSGDELLKAFVSIDALDVPDAKKEELKRDLERETVEQTHAGQIDRTFDNEGAQAALDQLGNIAKEVPKGFSPDEWDSFVASTQKNVNRRIAREAQGVKAAADAVEKDAKTARGKLFMDPGIPADPAKGSEDREDINLAYDDVSAEWGALPVQDQVNLNVEFVKNTGVVPNELISSINASMRSGTVDQVALMSDVVSRIQEESPQALKDIPDESRAVSLMVSDAMRSGVDAQTALDQARNFAFGMTEAQKTTIRNQSQGLSKDLPGNLQSFANRSVNKGGFDRGIFFNVPDISPAMLGEFQENVDLFMRLTGGNPDQSQLLAFQSIKKTWGITETGGPKRFMKFSPEVVYEIPGFGSNWIEDQFNEEAENLNLTDAIIAIDHTTARESRPSYPVLSQDENGVLQPALNENGEALRWRPDFKATEAYEGLAGAPEQVLAKAKEKRKVKLERRAGQIRRGIESRLFRGQFLSKEERGAFLQTDEGKQRALSAINSMEALGKLSEVEANEARKAFE